MSQQLSRLPSSVVYKSKKYCCVVYTVIIVELPAEAEGVVGVAAPEAARGCREGRSRGLTKCMTMFKVTGSQDTAVRYDHRDAV